MLWGWCFVSVIIKLPKLDIPVKRVEPVLIDVDNMVPHEEIVTRRLEDVKKMIMDLGAVDMPIIVTPIPGTDKYLIVDGHHRWAALKELGYRKAPAIVVDYFDDSIRLETWYPAIIGGIEDFLQEASKELDIKEVELNVEQAIKLLEQGDIAFIILSRDGKAWIIKGDVEEQKKVSKILNKLNVEGKIKLAYYGLREEAIQDLKKGEINYLFLRKPPTKQEVIEIARQGKVYSPKTTRHILPYIPAKTYTPLNQLK